MLIINLKNVKDLIVLDNKVTNLLPEFKHFFDTWKFSFRNPSFKSLGEKALIDFLLSLKPQHIKLLEQYFNTSISVNAMDYRIVKNINISLDNIEDLKTGEFPNFSIYRDSSRLYISLWR
jgi:hypothetical protein